MIRREDVEIEGNKIKVTVKLREYCNRDNKRVVTCTTKDVESALAEMGIEIGECLESSDLSNLYPRHSYGVWVFEQKVKRKSTRKKSYSKSSKPIVKKVENVENVEKNLDKSGEHVIIIEKDKLDNLLSEEG